MLLDFFKRLFFGKEEELEVLEESTLAFPGLKIQIKQTRRHYFYWRLINADGQVLALSNKTWSALQDCLIAASVVAHNYVGEIISSY